MAFRVLHKKSNLLINNKPKLPDSDVLEFGEIAINYAKDNETLSIKNSDAQIATFKSSNQTQDKLISGENIKTVNNISLLGKGNIEIGNFNFEIVNSQPTTISPINKIQIDITNGKMYIGVANTKWYSVNLTELNDIDDPTDYIVTDNTLLMNSSNDFVDETVLHTQGEVKNEILEIK